MEITPVMKGCGLGLLWQLSEYFGIIPYTYGLYDKPLWARSYRRMTILLAAQFAVTLYSVFESFKKSLTVGTVILHGFRLVRSALGTAVILSHFQSLSHYWNVYENLLKFKRKRLTFLYGTQLVVCVSAVVLTVVDAVGSDIMAYSPVPAFVHDFLVITIVFQILSLCTGVEMALERTTHQLKHSADPVAVTQYHSFLVALSDGLNSAVGPQLLITCVATFANIIPCLYFVLGASIAPASFQNSLRITYSILAALFWFICILTMARTGAHISEQAESFNKTLFARMRRNPHLCSNSKLKVYLKMKPSVQLSACGFFTIDYKLVTSVVGSVVTYLVILLQFTE